jgi:4-diphosphocytidyl-2-C-methyl-D-erythritol kinase
MIIFPNAKINIGLDILRKRNDGFHDIETVFYPIPLKDALEIVEDPESDKILFEQTGLIIDSDKGDNLCEKAVSLLRKEHDISGLKIHLHKVIPMGAGLGGGSADASFTLKLTNELFDLKLDNNKLRNVASELGSDCPFFIENKPMIAEGRGEILEKIELSLKGYFLVLVHPAIHVSTPKAYGMITPSIPEQSLKERICQPIETWKDILKNDFEAPIFMEHPELKKIKNKLYDARAIYSAMTGSGSALYGIFSEKVDLTDLFGDYFLYQEWLD